MRKKRKAGNRALVWLAEQKMSRIMFVFALAFIMLLIIGMFPFLLAADISAHGRFPPDVRIAGVEVGNLTKEQAVEKCRQELAEAAQVPLALKVDEESYSITPAEIGLQLDYERMVDEAYDGAWSVNLVERLARRLLKKPKAMDFPLAVQYDKQAVADFVKRAMDSIVCEPRDAYLEIITGDAVIVPGKDGRETDYEKVLAATERALALNQREIQVPITKRTPPEKKDLEIGKFILVNLGNHTLSLYDRNQLLARWPVATGSKEWPTAIGEWAVVKAEKNPTWYNRGSTWAENMPPSLPPGPGNPLGTRAITLNGGGVLIHGTQNTGSIGYSVSHGCIRMYMGDVETLFEHVYIGMPVYIMKRTGEPGFDYKNEPFWKDEDS